MVDVYLFAFQLEEIFESAKLVLYLTLITAATGLFIHRSLYKWRNINESR